MKEHIDNKKTLGVLKEAWPILRFDQRSGHKNTADVANVVMTTESVNIKLAAVMEATTEASHEAVEGVEENGAAVLARSAWWRAA